MSRVLRFFGEQQDFSALGEWLDEQPDFAALCPIREPECMQLDPLDLNQSRPIPNGTWIASRKHDWTKRAAALPQGRALRTYLWVAEAGLPEALVQTNATRDFFEIADPWQPFDAIDFRRTGPLLEPPKAATR